MDYDCVLLSEHMIWTRTKTFRISQTISMYCLRTVCKYRNFNHHMPYEMQKAIHYYYTECQREQWHTHSSVANVPNTYTLHIMFININNSLLWPYETHEKSSATHLSTKKDLLFTDSVTQSLQKHLAKKKHG